MKIHELDELALAKANFYGYNKGNFYARSGISPNTNIDLYDVVTKDKVKSFKENLILDNKASGYVYDIFQNNFILKNRLYYCSAQIGAYDSGASTGGFAGKVNSEYLCFDTVNSKLVNKSTELANIMALTLISYTKNKVKLFGLLRTKTAKNPSNTQGIMYYKAVYIDAEVDLDGNLVNIVKTADSNEYNYVYSTGQQAPFIFGGVVDNKVVLHSSRIGRKFYIDKNSNDFMSNVDTSSSYFYSHSGEEKRLTISSSNLIFNDTNKKVGLSTSYSAIQYSLEDNSVYIYNVFSKGSGLYSLRKNLIELDRQELILIGEQDITSSTSAIDGYNCGGKVFFSSNDSVIVPFIVEAESGKEKVTYEVFISRTIKVNEVSGKGTVRSAQIDSKTILKIERYINITNNVTRQSKRKVNIDSTSGFDIKRSITKIDIVREYSRRRAYIVDNQLRCTYRKISSSVLINSRTARRLAKDNNLLRPIIRNITEVNVTVKKFNSNRIVLVDKTKVNYSARKVTIIPETLAKVHRSTVLDKNTLTPTARTVIDMNITIHKVEALRQIISNGINMKPIVRHSHLNVESKLSIKRSIIIPTRLNEHLKRSVGGSNFIEANVNRNVVAYEGKYYNTIRRTIANYYRENFNNRRVAIINNITGYTKRTVILHNDYNKTIPSIRVIIIDKIDNYSNQRKVKALMKNDYRTLRVITLRATDSKVYYFNAVVPLTMDGYPIYKLNTKLGMDFN